MKKLEQHVSTYCNIGNEKTLLPVFAMIFFISLISYTVLAIIFQYPHDFVDFLKLLGVAVLGANLTLAITAIGYDYFTKDDLSTT